MPDVLFFHKCFRVLDMTLFITSSHSLRQSLGKPQCSPSKLAISLLFVSSNCFSFPLICKSVHILSRNATFSKWSSIYSSLRSYNLNCCSSIFTFVCYRLRFALITIKVPVMSCSIASIRGAFSIFCPWWFFVDWCIIVICFTKV